MKITSIMQAGAFTLLLAAFCLQTHNVSEGQEINAKLLAALQFSNEAIDASNDALAVAYDSGVNSKTALEAAAVALAECRGEELPADWPDGSVEPSGEWPQDELGTDIGSLSAEQWDVLTDATNIVGVTREPQ